MIIEEQGIIFIHIPKTAGESIEFLLEKNYEGNEKRKGRHQPLSFFLHRKFPTNIIFTVIRNPYARLVSVYNWCKLKVPFSRFLEVVKKIIQEGNMPFKTITPFNENNMHYPLRRCMVKGVEINSIMVEPFSFWVEPKMVEEGKVKVLCFEQIEQDWEKFKHEVGISDSLPHRNKGRKVANFRKFYRRKEDVELVKELYGWELDYFGYSL